ncbi:dTDP-4-amino-4,6-dideoxygalactose transaminase [Roseovarius sp. M141]|uniref:dTDP-4-amino-4,6-dideoxygalactose transaminase n=1 Tax=Roseovarius sp. M141 TaxID=2583806 RepID=UPI0020CB72A6|nr:dTDP-4-amino-4,6-dideoxygalactose transaminase [Roseovarius sp. M141]
MKNTIPFNKPSIVGNEIKYIRDAVRQGQLAGDGVYTDKCSKHLGSLTGAKKVLLTHSCTAALEMAAMLCDLGPGDEVIMPSFTFVSTANAVVLRGATPVFVDIQPDTLNIDPIAVSTAITQKTKAIFAVHYAGFPADMDALADLAKKHGLFLIEDAAQALGSTYKGRLAGSLSDMAAFSFHETKNIISGEGGALAINRSELMERAEIIREKGTNRSQFFRGQVDKYTWVDVGSSYLPGELIAAYLYGQLEAEPAIRTRRLAVFDAYMDALTPLVATNKVTLPYTPLNCTGNGHMFYLLLDSLESRSAFIAEMKAHNIITPFHYVPLHSAPAGKRFGRAHGDLPVTQRISETLVRLPMYFDLGSDIETVIDVALNVLGNTPRGWT